MKVLDPTLEYRKRKQEEELRKKILEVCRIAYYHHRKPKHLNFYVGRQAFDKLPNWMKNENK